jgi:hypothetical protein
MRSISKDTTWSSWKSAIPTPTTRPVYMSRRSASWSPATSPTTTFTSTSPSNAQTRREWISALDTIESLNPRAVIAGHKRHGNDDSPKIIEETRRYIRDFDRVAETTTALELYDKMLERYRIGPIRG